MNPNRSELCLVWTYFEPIQWWICSDFASSKIFIYWNPGI